MTRTRFALAGAAAILALAIVPLAAARAHPAKAPSVTKAQSVTVTLKEFKFIFSAKAVHPGVVTFHLVNAGHVAHDLRIAGKTSPMLLPGKKAVLVVTLKKGKYPYLCTVPGHAAAGMKGTLTVK
jgi:uncharacterized cupredoxin-like copper-binding protein